MLYVKIQEKKLFLKLQKLPKYTQNLEISTKLKNFRTSMFKFIPIIK